jgi:hypothetical protein
MLRSSGAKHRERQHENTEQASSIQRSGDEIGILLVDPGPVVPKIILHKQSGGDDT